MIVTRNRVLRPTILFSALGVILTFALACGSSATATPRPAATAVPAASPTARPATTATSPAATQPKYGGTMRYARELGDIDTMDPALNSQYSALMIYRVIYNGLVTLNTDGTIGPDLAKSWNISSDGKTVTLSLQSGVKFQDGTDFNAQAVKWNFDRMLDEKTGSPQRAAIGAFIDTVDVVNNDTVTVKLKSPFRPFLGFLSDRPGFVVSPAAVQKDPQAFGKQPVGTGPFKMNQWIPKSDIKAEINKNYWEKGKPYMDGILFQSIPDDSVRLSMLRTGETDFIDEVLSTQLPLVASNPNIKVISYESGRIHAFTFTVVNAPFDNKALRQAISYATNRQEFVDVFYAGKARPAYTLIGFGWASNPDIRVQAFDLAKAKQKLADAGYPNGITIPLTCITTDSGIRRCEIWQAQLKNAGINAEIKQLNANDYWGASFLPDVKARPGLSWTWWNPRADPHQLLQIVFHSKGLGNTMAYNNLQVDKLLEDGATLYDVAKAKEKYDEAQKLIADDAPYNFLLYENINNLTSQRVQNFQMFPDLFIRLREVWLNQ